MWNNNFKNFLVARSTIPKMNWHNYMVLWDRCDLNSLKKLQKTFHWKQTSRAFAKLPILDLLLATNNKHPITISLMSKFAIIFFTFFENYEVSKTLQVPVRGPRSSSTWTCPSSWETLPLLIVESVKLAKRKEGEGNGLSKRFQRLRPDTVRCEGRNTFDIVRKYKSWFIYLINLYRLFWLFFAIKSQLMG